MLGINRAYGKNSLSKNLLKMVSVRLSCLLLILRYIVDMILKVIFPLFLLSPPYFGLVFKSCGCIEIR